MNIQFCLSKSQWRFLGAVICATMMAPVSAQQAIRPAQRREITYTQTLVWTPGGSTTFPCSLPKFDSTLGTLRGVETSRTISFEGSVGVENPPFYPAGPNSFHLYAQATVQEAAWGQVVFGDSFVQAVHDFGPFMLGEFDGVLDGEGISGVTIGTIFSTTDAFLPQRVHFNSFLGTGSLPITFTLTGGIGIGGHPLYHVWGSNVRAVARYTVRYRYS